MHLSSGGAEGKMHQRANQRRHLHAVVAIAEEALALRPDGRHDDRENERPTRRATRSGARPRDRWRDDDGKKRSGRARGRECSRKRTTHVVRRERTTRANVSSPARRLRYLRYLRYSRRENQRSQHAYASLRLQTLAPFVITTRFNIARLDPPRSRRDPRTRRPSPRSTPPSPITI